MLWSAYNPFMLPQSKSLPNGWLAFDLNILSRLNFSSVCLPFTGDPTLGSFLKTRGVRVLTNDLLRSSWTRSVAVVQNNREKLSDDTVNAILEEVYVPHHRLRNPALTKWFSETDAWWFDNIRSNLDRIESPFQFAIGASLAMAVGDYAMSFTEETRELRQPFSNVFRRLWTMLPEPVNNGQNNICHNRPVNDFIAESYVDLMYLRLPAAAGKKGFADKAVWREEWLRGGDDFWHDIESMRDGRLGMPVHTKSQYLELLKKTLETASNIEKWAIGHIETGFISTQEIVETIGRVQRVDTVYTKDFSELTGAKAIIITA